MKERKLDHWFDELVLYVRRLDTPTVRAAVEASSPEPGGYRLRYYRAAPGAPSSCGVGKAWTDLGNGGCGAAETILKDGRDSPSSPPPSGGAPSSRAAACALLRPHGLFVKLDAAHASARRPHGGGRRAAFLLTPRKTRPRILDSFRPRTLTAAPRPNLRRPSLWLCAAGRMLLGCPSNHRPPSRDDRIRARRGSQRRPSGRCKAQRPHRASDLALDGAGHRRWRGAHPSDLGRHGVRLRLRERVFVVFKTSEKRLGCFLEYQAAVVLGAEGAQPSDRSSSSASAVK